MRAKSCKSNWCKFETSTGVRTIVQSKAPYDDRCTGVMILVANGKSSTSETRDSEVRSVKFSVKFTVLVSLVVVDGADVGIRCACITIDSMSGCKVRQLQHCNFVRRFGVECSRSCTFAMTRHGFVVGVDDDEGTAGCGWRRQMDRSDSDSSQSVSSVATCSQSASSCTDCDGSPFERMKE